MNKLTNAFIAAVVAVVVALGVTSVAAPKFPTNVLTDVGQGAEAVGATASGLSSVVFSHLTNLEANQNLGVVSTFFQGATAEGGTPLQVNVSAPTSGSTDCNTSTSTLFAIQPPSGATSTVMYLSLAGTVAQTSDIIVGTSTKPGGMTATSTLNVTGIGGLVGAAGVTTGKFYFVNGLKVGPGTGYTTTGNGPYGSQTGIVVGPSEYLVGYATSTGVTGGNGATACSYKIEWYN